MADNSVFIYLREQTWSLSSEDMRYLNPHVIIWAWLVNVIYVHLWIWGLEFNSWKHCLYLYCQWFLFSLGMFLHISFCIISGLYPRGLGSWFDILYLSKRVSQCWVSFQPKPGDSHKTLAKAWDMPGRFPSAWKWVLARKIPSVSFLWYSHQGPLLNSLLEETCVFPTD